MKASDIAQSLGIKNKEEFESVIDDLMREEKLRFDKEITVFTYTLRSPLKLGNGDTIDLISIKEPTGADLAQVSDMSKPITLAIEIVARQNAQPTAIIERIGAHDLNNIIQVVNFFM